MNGKCQSGLSDTLRSRLLSELLLANGWRGDSETSPDFQKGMGMVANTDFICDHCDRARPKTSQTIMVKRGDNLLYCFCTLNELLSYFRNRH